MSRRKFNLIILMIAAGWILTRFWMVSQLGYFHTGISVSYEDVNIFHAWAKSITSSGSLPTDDAWQYPPGAAFLFLIPWLNSSHYMVSFMMLMLIIDLVATIAIAFRSLKEAHFTGIAVYLILMPALGSKPLLRFDLAPTAVMVIALAVAWNGTRPRLFGILAGVGFYLKVWPIIILLATPTRRFMGKTIGIFLSFSVVILGLAFSLWGNPLGSFLTAQKSRGLELEAVGASPWYLRQAVFGIAVPHGLRYGSNEVISGTADVVAKILRFLMILITVYFALWWYSRTQDKKLDPALGRDAVLVGILCYLVVSPVLSPQYMIWLVGIISVITCGKYTVVGRPLLLSGAAVLLTQALLQNWGGLVSNGASSAYILVARNLVLLAAAVDGLHCIGIPNFRTLKPPSLVLFRRSIHAKNTYSR